MGVGDTPQNATGRDTQSGYNALTSRVAYRAALAAVDIEADLANDVKVPPINLKKSKQAQTNAIFLFMRLLGGMTSATVELWVNALDVVAAAVPAEDATDWCLVESATLTKNGLVRLDGANHRGLPAGTYKILFTVTVGGGTLVMHHQHTGYGN